MGQKLPPGNIVHVMVPSILGLASRNASFFEGKVVLQRTHQIAIMQ